MSEQEHPTSVVEPVGRQGARVEIQQRQAAMITGWLEWPHCSGWRQ